MEKNMQMDWQAEAGRANQLAAGLAARCDKIGESNDKLHEENRARSNECAALRKRLDETENKLLAAERQLKKLRKFLRMLSKGDI